MKQHTEIQRSIREELQSKLLDFYSSIPPAISMTDDIMMNVDAHLFYLEAKKIGDYDSFFTIVFDETVYKIHKQTEIALYNQLKFLRSLDF